MYALSGLNAEERNLIAGTRYFNATEMLEYEETVKDYVDETGDHVAYRVTPAYEGDDLVARGVLMEAESVEDDGEGLSFCVWCPNVQPGIEIDYATGESKATDGSAGYSAGTQVSGDVEEADNYASGDHEYVVNEKSKTFHEPDCSGVEKMNPENRNYVVEDREDLLEDGYKACGICKP